MPSNYREPVVFGTKGAGAKNRPDKGPKGSKNKIGSAAAFTIKAFEELGCTSHSRNAETLPYVINYCEANGINFRLTAHPGAGYFIEKV